MFSNEGGISKDYISLCTYLPQYCNLFTLVNETELQTEVEGIKEKLVLNIGKKNIIGLFNPINYKKLRKFIEKNNIKYIYFFSHTPFNIFALSVVRKQNIYAFLHNPNPHKGTMGAFAFIERYTNHRITKKAKKVFVASDYQRKMLEKDAFYSKYIKKINVQYLGMQESMKIDVADTSCDIDVLFFGRIEYYKGIDLLLEALSEMPSINCTIIGKGNCEYVIPPNVTMINRFVPDYELAKYINRSKMGCLPYREATGTAIIQTFFYHKKPVVVTDTGCMSEYVKNGYSGYVIPVGDKTALKNAIFRLGRNEELLNNMGVNAYNELKMFDYNLITRDLISKIED